MSRVRPGPGRPHGLGVAVLGLGPTGTPIAPRTDPLAGPSGRDLLHRSRRGHDGSHDAGHKGTGAAETSAASPQPAAPASPPGQAAITPTPDRNTEDEVLELIPKLRAYARALTRDVNDADDLVQETLLKALSNIDSFQPGTMLRAWLYTIMRNTFHTNIRKRQREQPGAEDCVSERPVSLPDHDRVIQSKQVMAAIRTLPDHYRETLVLVVMLGQSYQEVAQICGIGMGTVKSRVNRARKLVMQQIGPDALEDFGRD